ncbi:M48 family metallopeptidase [Phenylobacterium sp. LjRoot219]|uniref:M48 family metallopeptidase n=1 Tax=Phenylobacterium sp. LjRoot219 TaxID=3342283 RepID=UPI003ECC8C80
MRMQTAAVAMAALGLIAWVEPKTATPLVAKDAAAEEAKRQMVYVHKTRAKEAQRVQDIAFRIMVANQDLCADRAPRLGMDWDVADSFDAKVRPAAVEAYKIGDGVTVTQVIAGSPAAAAGLQPGDVVVSVNGEAAPTGKRADRKLSKRVDEIKGASTAPLTFVVRRAGQEQTLAVTPVMACAYGVAVADQPELNAYADGKNIHITRPMLRFAASDEELALVIAHEIAHNGQHHIQAKQKNAAVLGVPGLLIDIAAAAGGVNTNGAFAKAGMQYGASRSSAAFEAEADYVGMYYLARAGYPTDGVEDFWRKMAVEEPNAIFIKSTHPATPDRFLAIASADDEIGAKRAKGEPLTPNQKVNEARAAEAGGAK